MIKSTNTITTFLLGTILGLATVGAAPAAGAAPPGPGKGLSPPDAASRVSAAARPAVQYSRIPLYFEANQGQAPQGVRFISRGQGYVLYLSDVGPRLVLDRFGTGGAAGRNRAARAVIGMRLAGAKTGVTIHGRLRQPGVVNYLVGKDPRRWHRGVPTYRRVVYSDVYPGIDLVYHGRQTRLEYDFKVAPGADPKAIRLSFSGIKGMRVDRAGRLHLRTGGGDVIEEAPVAYQWTHGVRRAVAVRYVLSGAHGVSFAVADYDRRGPLVIDPVLSFSSYLGGGQNDRALAVANDPGDGNTVFITGSTASADFLDGSMSGSCGGDFGCTQNSVSYIASDAVLNADMWIDSNALNVVRNDRLLLITDASKGAEASTTTKLQVAGNFSADVAMTQLDEAYKFSGLEVRIGGNTYDWGVSSTASAQQFELTASNGGAGCSSSAPALVNDVSAGSPFVAAQDVEAVRSQGTLKFYYRAAGAASFTLGGTCTNVSSADAAFRLFVVTREDPATQTTAGKTSVFRDFQLTFSTAASAGSQATATVTQSTQEMIGDFEAHVTLNNLDVANKTSGMELQIGSDTYTLGISSTAATSQQLDSSCSSAVLDLGNVGAQDIKVQRRQGTLIFYYRTPHTIQFTQWQTCTGVSTGPAAVKLFVKTGDGTAKTSAFDDFYAEKSSGAPDAFVMRLNNGQLGYATYLGGSGEDEGRAIRADSSGNAFVAGRTDSADLGPTYGPACPDTNGDLVCDNGGDAFVAKLGVSGGLSFVTYFGGCYDDGANAIDLDGSGNIYIAGYTSSASDAATSSAAATCVTGFPAQTPGAQPALQTVNHGRTDAFVAEYQHQTGDTYTLRYATYLGGAHSDEALGIAVSATGEAYVTGDTASSDFPEQNADPNACPNCDSTHYHAFVAKINQDATALDFSTLLGGSDYDYGSAITVDGSGSAYVTGWTRSPDFPAVGTSIQPDHGGDYDVFFSRFDASGTLDYSTYLGTTNIEAGQGIAIDSGCSSDCDVWITGYTEAPDLLVALLMDVRADLDAPLDFLQDFQSVSDPSSDSPEQVPDTDEPHDNQPILNNYVLDNLSVGDLAEALGKLLNASSSPAQQLLGSENNCGYSGSAAVDANGLTSLSRSGLICIIFDTVNTYVQDRLHPIQSVRLGTIDAFAIKLRSTGASAYTVDQATYLGGRHENYGTGITLDGSGNPYVVGYTQAADFPVTGGAIQAEYCPSDNSDNACGEDGFVAKIVKGDVDLSVTMTSDAPSSKAVDPGTNVTFTMTVKNNSAQEVSGVQLVDNVPIGQQLVKVVPADQCTPSSYDAASFNHTVTCNLGALKGGATAVVSVTVMATAETESQTQDPGTTEPTGPPPQVNSASVTGLATDNNPANNSASIKISVNRTFIPPENTPHPVLSQKFPTFPGIDPPGGGGGLGLLSLAALAAGAGWRRRSGGG